MTPAVESAESTGGIRRIDAGCEALAGGGVFPRDVRAPRPESSPAHLGRLNDLAN
jgi:hypothetical protein